MVVKIIKFPNGSARHAANLDKELYFLTNLYKKSNLYFLKYYTCARYQDSDTKVFLVTEKMDQPLSYGKFKRELETMNLYTKLEILLMVTRALRFLESYKITHLDVKPGNIMINKVNEVWVPKLIDYGLIKKHGQPNKNSTAYYMDPASTETSARSDIYSLVMTFEDILTNFDTLRRVREYANKQEGEGEKIDLAKYRPYTVSLIQANLEIMKEKRNLGIDPSMKDQIAVYEMINNVVSYPKEHTLTLTVIRNTLEQIIRGNKPESIYLTENLHQLEALVLKSKESDVYSQNLLK